VIPTRPAPATAAVSGVLGAGLSLGVGELLAAPLASVPSPVVAVGRAVIDLAPRAVREGGIETFGTADKPALVIGTIAIALAVGAVVGVASRRALTPAVAAFATFGAIGVLAAANDPTTWWPLAALVAAVTAGAGVLTLRTLLRAAPHAGVKGPLVDLERRRFLMAAVGAGSVALVAGSLGRAFAGGGRAAAARARTVLRRPASPLPAAPAGLVTTGISPLLTPLDRFFRIDTALTVPDVDVATWRLKVGGMVDRPFSLTYDDLAALPQVEADITLCCVSNEVGGKLIGTARWQGVPLRDLLERAGVQPGASQLVGRSVDGFTVGFPTSVLDDGRQALVALGMAGEPLPLRHGFPARLVVPGLYGYVSATKWLEEIELTTLDAFDAYWIPRGWAKEAPIKTSARIDVPRSGQRLTGGRQAVAGVAWAPTRRIRRVEVQVDDGPWAEAELGPELSADTWRQWVWPWEAGPGEHVLRVRAVDGTGREQETRVRPPAPDGASGLHEIRVAVAAAPPG
jgi:DMSO/TMAO reductase YedYZ molybdopterin-dependent catalytic subunit